MRESQNLTIGVLSITGVVLLVAVIFATAGSQNPAMAIGQTDRGGDYIVVTGQFNDNSEVIYITDAAAQRMNMYSYQWNRGQLTLWDSYDLKRAFGERKRRGGKQ